MRCPNCGEEVGTLKVCSDCGKIYCWMCHHKDKHLGGSDICPRCESANNQSFSSVQELREKAKYQA